MSDWIAIACVIGAVVIGATVLTLLEQRRQRRWAQTRKPISEEEFCLAVQNEEVAPALATFLWEEFKPYYFNPLTPYPSDRVYGDLKIDADDIGDIALNYEKKFGVELKGNPIECPADPTLAELGTALARASR